MKCPTCNGVTILARGFYFCSTINCPNNGVCVGTAPSETEKIAKQCDSNSMELMNMDLRIKKLEKEKNED